MEPSVQVEYSGGMQNSMPSSVYIEKGYKPWMNELPSMEDYFKGKNRDEQDSEAIDL